MADDDKTGAKASTANKGTGARNGGAKDGARGADAKSAAGKAGARASTKAAPKATSGRRARHSAQKKEPVTIDLEPAKSEPARDKKAASAAAPAPAKAAAAKSTDGKPSAGKAEDAKTADQTDTKAAPAAAAAKSSVPAAGGKAASTGTVPPKADAPKSDALKSEAPKSDALKSDAPKPTAASKPVETKPVATPPPPAKTSESKSGTGFGGLLAAGIVGGVVTLGGAWAFGAFDDDASDIETLRTELGQRIDGVASSAPDGGLTREDVDASIRAALAARTDNGTPAEPDPRIDTLSAELAATRQELAALQQSIATVGEGAADGTALAALAARIADLDTRVVAATDGAAQPVPTDEDIAAIADRAATGRVTALEGSLDGRIGTALQPLQESLGAVEAQVSQLSSSVTANGERAATLETGLGELRSTVETGLASVRESTGASVEALRADLTARFDEQGGTLTSLQEANAAQDERLAQMAEQVADTDPERRAATALALANLRTRIDDGEAYSTELALVRRTNPKVDLAPLDGTAATGIPTLAGLQNRFETAAEAIREAVRPTPDAGVGGLLANLRSVVKVKPLDGTPGQDIEATLGAIRQNLADGDLATAEAAWQALPEAGRQASTAWHGDLVARMKAKNFLSEALASLLEETGG